MFKINEKYSLFLVRGGIATVFRAVRGGRASRRRTGAGRRERDWTSFASRETRRPCRTSPQLLLGPVRRRREHGEKRWRPATGETRRWQMAVSGYAPRSSEVAVVVSGHSGVGPVASRDSERPLATAVLPNALAEPFRPVVRAAVAARTCHGADGGVVLVWREPGIAVFCGYGRCRMGAECQWSVHRVLRLKVLKKILIGTFGKWIDLIEVHCDPPSHQYVLHSKQWKSDQNL